MKNGFRTLEPILRKVHASADIKAIKFCPDDEEIILASMYALIDRKSTHSHDWGMSVDPDDVTLSHQAIRVKSVDARCSYAAWKHADTCQAGRCHHPGVRRIHALSEN